MTGEKFIEFELFEPLPKSFSDSTSRGYNLVDFNPKPPKNAKVLHSVPYVPNGFENSCSECSAEMILRYYGIIGWSQYEIHARGYHTYEGGISEGDLGIKTLFNCETFRNARGNIIKLQAEERENALIEDLREILDFLPIIIRIFTDYPRNSNRHTIVLVGYNEYGFFKHDNDNGANLYVSNARMEQEFSGNLLIVRKI